MQNFPKCLMRIYNFSFRPTGEVKVDDLPVQITLCDTAGQDFFDPLRRLCYPDSDVFLLCFSVVKPKTFKSIQNKWAPNLSKSRASIVLIGTQADLRSDPKTIAQLKVIDINLFIDWLPLGHFSAAENTKNWYRNTYAWSINAISHGWLVGRWCVYIENWVNIDCMLLLFVPTFAARLRR